MLCIVLPHLWPREGQAGRRSGGKVGGGGRRRREGEREGGQGKREEGGIWVSYGVHTDNCSEYVSTLFHPTTPILCDLTARHLVTM